MQNDVRLIDANALKEWLGCDGDNKYSSMIMHEIADRIDEQPTIDAVPVVHGRWVWTNSGWCCSVCHKKSMVEAVAFAKYCHRCGARMDAKEE